VIGRRHGQWAARRTGHAGEFSGADRIFCHFKFGAAKCLTRVIAVA
jgi:hypothetical protein